MENNQYYSLLKDLQNLREITRNIRFYARKSWKIDLSNEVYCKILI